MYKLTLLFSVLLTVNATAMVETLATNSKPDSKITYKTMEEIELEDALFNTNDNLAFDDFDVASIEVIDIEEDVEINFDTKAYLPANFNPLKGMYDLDWNTIELVALEEDVELGFNTQAYLPKNFNALKGMHDLDWNTIELVELEEDVELGFDTNTYLPKDFNPYKCMDCEKGEVVCLY